MAQEAKNDGLIQKDTSSDVGLEFSYKWSIRTPEMISSFTKCEPDTTVTSPFITSSLEFDGEQTTMDWYIIAYPNGNLKHWENSSNLFMIVVRVVALPRVRSMEIKSLRMRHWVNIPQLNIVHSQTHNFDTKSGLGGATIGSPQKINKAVFSRYNVEKNGGFDILMKVFIENVTFKLKNQNAAQFRTDKMAAISNNYNRDSKINTIEILTRLEKMQNQLDQISRQLNDNGKQQNKKNSIGAQNKLEQWILNIFGGNEEAGKEYVKMIIENEGFDDIDVFCNLNENDLKEIGINKKGHRMKFIQTIKEYNGKKIQSLMMNKNMNVNVAPGAALDVQETEGKE